MLSDIPTLLDDISAGRMVILMDDEDRENEGDFLVAARHATPEVVNFMATHGRGLICAPLVEDLSLIHISEPTRPERISDSGVWV